MKTCRDVHLFGLNEPYLSLNLGQISIEVLLVRCRSRGDAVIIEADGSRAPHPLAEKIDLLDEWLSFVCSASYDTMLTVFCFQ